MDQLSEEHSEQETNLASLLLKIEKLNFSIGANLEPKISETTGKIHELYEMRNQLDAARNKDLQIFELESELKSLGEKPVSKRVNILDGSETVTLSKAKRKFSDALENRLFSWKFPNVGTTEFTDKYDVVIDGQARATHGKGFRVIVHAAFSLTLMMEFRERHTNFIVIDSPLTSFKQKDSYSVSSDIKKAFYSDLCSISKDVQVIVMENEDPPTSYRERMNFQHFSGNADVGRSGFYPAYSK